MTELQYLILKNYNNRKKINSYEFYETFLRGKPQYTKQQLQTEVQYLHESEFLSSAKGEYNTLCITPLGEQKFEVERKAMELRQRWKNTPPFPNSDFIPKGLPGNNQELERSFLTPDQIKAIPKTKSQIDWKSILTITAGIITLITAILKAFGII